MAPAVDELKATGTEIKNQMKDAVQPQLDKIKNQLKNAFGQALGGINLGGLFGKKK